MKRAPLSNVKGPDATPGAGVEPDDLADLVLRFRAGDEAAFDRIVERLTPRLQAIAQRLLGNAEAAEEAVQDAWVRIYDRIGDVQDAGAFEGWATRVTLSRVHDAFRVRSRERAAKEGLAGLRAAVGSPPEKVSASEREDLARVLREAIASLDDVHREVFVLREIEGLSHERISRMLGTPEGTVWSRLSYARARLREYLKRRRDDVT